jgi:hypothetical protein
MDAPTADLFPDPEEQPRYDETLIEASPVSPLTPSAVRRGGS